MFLQGYKIIRHVYDSSMLFGLMENKL